MRDKMTVAKRILNIFTVAVVIALVSCTFISKYIFDMRTPVVSVVKPASMEINGEMYYTQKRGFRRKRRQEIRICSSRA